MLSSCHHLTLKYLLENLPVRVQLRFGCTSCGFQEIYEILLARLTNYSNSDYVIYIHYAPNKLYLDLYLYVHYIMYIKLINKYVYYVNVLE